MKVCYPIKIKLLSALHINGGTDANGIRVTVRSGGNAYIPATLIKGLIRENFFKLWSALYGADDPECTGFDDASSPCSCTTCSMFGKAGYKMSRVYVDNFTSAQKLSYMRRSNVSIDRYTRKSLDRALVFTEVVDRFAKVGGKVENTVFSGNITVYYPPELPKAQQYRIEAVLLEAIRSINYIGLGKSRGMGFVEISAELPEGGA